MAPVTIVFGIVLIVLGAGSYVGTGSAHPTSLIPAAFGGLLLLLGLIALKESLRKHAMHFAAMIGLLGFLGGAIMGVPKLPALLAGTAERPTAVIEQLALAVICLAFVALCVRSFIAARSARSKREAT